jgi:hypothetical protein
VPSPAVPEVPRLEALPLQEPPLQERELALHRQASQELSSYPQVLQASQDSESHLLALLQASSHPQALQASQDSASRPLALQQESSRPQALLESLLQPQELLHPLASSQPVSLQESEWHP